LGRISTRSFFLFIFILQVAPIFQGFDLSDEGFLSIFYRRIFSDPESVSYNFMFWLTGIIGGTWARLFSPMGLLAIRLAGAAVNVLTTILTYRLLKKYLNPEYLKIGLLLVVLSLNNDIKVINYNTLSSLFYVLAVYLVFSGLQKNEIIKILAGGFVVGLNVFVRAPNILELGIVMGIFYYRYLNPGENGKVLRQTAAFISGFAMAVCVVIMAMYLIGHLQIFKDSIKLLFAMGKNEPLPAATQTGYGLSRLVFIFWSNNVQSLKYALFMSAAILGSLYLFNAIRTHVKYGYYLVNTILAVYITLILYLIFAHLITHFTILFFITGLILLGSASLILSSVDGNIKMLLFFGLFFLITFPLGSSDGIYTAGRYCLWLALPIVTDYLLRIQFVNNLLMVNRDNRQFLKKIDFPADQLTYTKKLVIGLLVIAGLYHLFYYPFFDRRSRFQMHYALDAKNLTGIYTTKGRADAFNELLQESAKYIKPDDRVLAYDHIAMYYYATNTTPYLSNSLPSVYSAGLFQADLQASLERNKMLPPVIMQKIGTIGNDSKWPEEIQPGNYEENVLNLERNHILDTFLVKNNYRKIWENVAFKILIPEEVTVK
jgi:hypothetical protein